MKSRVIVASSKQNWIDRSVKLILESANQAIRKRGRFSLVLAGGSTPPREFPFGLESLADRYGVEKLMDAVARMQEKD